ncbi:hypothetical protein TcCL_NonESM02435 [Trypanosoma cruzi]|nr:hypothetical protein TcCL_NonESM02435 [Trypanosoma cruzi]
MDASVVKMAGAGEAAPKGKELLLRQFAGSLLPHFRCVWRHVCRIVRARRSGKQHVEKTRANVKRENPPHRRAASYGGHTIHTLSCMLSETRSLPQSSSSHRASRRRSSSRG